MNLDDLPPIVLIQTVLEFPIHEIVQLCNLSKSLNQKLCQNEDFWQKKYLHDYGSPAKSPLIWREAYRQTQTHVYAFGWNEMGQLGLGDYQDRNILTLIPLNQNIAIKKISTGQLHSLILSKNGQVYSFGKNEDRQLGLGDDRDRNVPTLIQDIPKIKAISAGGHNNLILSDDGQVYSFGFNRGGQLGLGDRDDRINPTLIPNLPKIIKISVGFNHSLLLSGGEGDEDGQIYVFGNNMYGQLGLGDNLDRNIPTPIPNLPKIKEISAGEDHSLLLSDDGQVYSFGNNRGGKLGLGDKQKRLSPTLIPNLPKIKVISAGSDHSLILSEDGQAYSFGDNSYGQLGLGDEQDRLSPTLIPNLPKIIKISAGVGHSLILSEDGQAYSFGDNSSGQLGLGDNLDRLSPTLIPNLSKIIKISAGGFHSLVLAQPLALFSTIQTLIQKNWIQNIEIISQTPDRNTMMKFTDIQGNDYQIRVRYDPDINQIFPLSS